MLTFMKECPMMSNQTIKETQMLTSTEQLFVRACKSRDTIKRLHSVYRRFYIKQEMGHEQKCGVLASLLAGIVDKCELKILANDVANMEDRIFGDSHGERTLGFMINKIRFTEYKKLEPFGLTRLTRNR